MLAMWNFKQRMELGYFRWDIHVLLSTSPLSHWVLAGSRVTRGSANFSAVSTFVIKGKRFSLVNFCEPRHEVFLLTVSRAPSWRREDSVPVSHESREGWVYFHNRLLLGNRKLTLWPIISQAFKIAQTGFWCQFGETRRVTDINS